MEPGLNQSLGFRNESAAVTTTEARKIPVKTSSVTPSVTAGTNSELCDGSFKFTWIVENFSYLTAETTLIGASGGLDFNKAIKSPLFVIGDVATHHWALLLHPTVAQYAKDSQLQNPHYERSSWVGVHLQLQRPSENIQQVDFTISLLNSMGERVHILEKSVEVCNGYMGESKPRYVAVMSGSLGGCSGWPDFFPRQTLMGASNTLLADNKLTIRCDMLISYKSAIRPDGASNAMSLKNGMDLRCDPWDMHMYRLQKGIDVILRCGKTEFGAHKRVLAASSTFFKELFQSQPAEDYDILNVSNSSMRVVLDWIYGAGIEYSLTPKLCRDVYTAAKYLALPNLMQMCAKIFDYNMRVRFVLDVSGWAKLRGNEEMFAELKRELKAIDSEVSVSPERREVCAKETRIGRFNL